MSEEQNPHNEGEENNEEGEEVYAGAPQPVNPYGLDLMQYLLQAHMLDQHPAGNNEGLVKGLKKRKLITSERIGQAFLAIPRGEFLAEEMLEEAYQDSPLRFASFGINISAPHMYATCLEALQLEPGNSFLDIGSGCGHMTCLGGYLVGKDGISHGLDIRQDIIEYSEAKTRAFSKKSSIDLSNVSYFLRNCFLPDKEGRLYDRIHVGACCPESRLKALYALLAPGGILVTPYADKLIKVTKGLDGKDITSETLANVRYGDLIIPSEAEMREARIIADEYRAMRVVVPVDSIVDDFASLVNSKTHSDVVFIVQGKPVFAHRFMLAFRCPYLYELTGKHSSGNSNNTNNNNSAHTEIEEVKVAAISYDVFVSILRYIYCGSVAVSPINLTDVMQAAIEFHLPNLVSECKNHARSPAEALNVLHVREPIAAALSDLVNSEKLSDVVFVVEGKRVYGHRFVLAIRSQYFRSVLTMGLKETGQSEIAIQEVSHDSFITVLGFLYTGRVGLVTEDNVVDVLEAANYLSEERLKCVCEDVLKRGMDLENVSYLLMVAVRFEADQLRRVCTETIIKNFDVVAQTKTFAELERGLLVVIMSEACNRLKRSYAELL